jgi:hypothetical protein
MNWKLPSGRVVRIGERVVKSTTGYDLMKFLLNSSGRFGEPVDFVIRLRPECGTMGAFTLMGDSDSIENAASSLIATCWMHWFESIDVVCRGSGCELRVELNCDESEWQVYTAHLAAVAQLRGLSMKSEINPSPHFHGCPDFVLKTTPDRAISLAREITASANFTCVALCACGVVHGYAISPAQIARIAEIVSRYEAGLFEVGGDWRSRHVAPAEPTGVEAQWLTQLEREFSAA